MQLLACQVEFSIHFIHLMDQYEVNSTDSMHEIGIYYANLEIMVLSLQLRSKYTYYYRIILIYYFRLIFILRFYVSINLFSSLPIQTLFASV